MAGDSSQEKTEQPTPHKISEARKKGQVAKSTELASAISLLVGSAAVIAMALWIPRKLSELYLAIERSIPHLHTAQMIALLSEAARLVVILSAPLLLIVAIVGTLATAVQAGPVFSVEPLKPKMEKLNPATNIKNLFSMRTVVQLVLMLLKTLVIGIALLLILRLVVPDAIRVIYAELGGALAISRRTLMLMALWCGGLFVMLGFADFAYQRYQWLKDLKMSPQEVKREHKEQEGDPLIKSMRRMMASEDTPAELMQYVGRCSIVVAEPGGRAVALFYNAERTPLPVPIVRGGGEVAREIVSRASDAGVAIRFDPVLLDRVYRAASPGFPVSGDLGSEIIKLLAQS